MKRWKTLKTKTILESPWLSVYKDEVLLPSGRVEKAYYRTPMPDFALAVVFTRGGEVLMLRHYRHGVGRVIYGLPAGHLERGERPLAAAKRELMEETGYAAPRWESLGGFVCNSNRHGGTAHIFLARGAVRKASPVTDDLEESELLEMPPAQAFALIGRRGALTLSSAAALGLAAMRLPASLRGAGPRPRASRRRPPAP